MARITDQPCPACGRTELVYDDEHSVYYCDACDLEPFTVATGATCPGEFVEAIDVLHGDSYGGGALTKGTRTHRCHLPAGHDGACHTDNGRVGYWKPRDGGAA